MLARLRSTLTRLFFFFFFCVLWYGVARYLAVIPGPIEVLRDIITLFQNGLIFDILISALRVAVALMISLIAGVTLGLLSTHISLVDEFLKATLVPVIEAFPPLAWTIICVLIIGIGERSVLFVVCIVLVQFFVVSVIESYKNLDNDIIEMAQSVPLGQMITSNRMNLLKHVELAMIIPYLITATRLAYGVSWKVIVIAEMFGASEGIGYLINQAYSTLSITRVVSLSTLIVIFFFLGDYLVLQTVEKRLRKWQES